MNLMKGKFVGLIRRFTWLDWLLLVLLFGFFAYLVVVSGSRIFNRRPAPVEFLAGEAKGAMMGNIWIDVSGSVVSPGVYELPAQSRVKDALVAAGGFSESADREYVAREINLAAKAVDGQKIFVPALVKSGMGVTAPGSSAITKINVNSASATQLMTLPGIGEARAADIIKNRPYIKGDDLVTKKVLSKTVFDKIRDIVTAY
ncbi:hypothetical protein A2703_00255 [Candidatus Collierbacteria bacterium RIFCSPHIGHO2_01_FULL_50_25]|uniref:Soluble ligand binding domain-containing protein n=1 Tax=Candidatus Collierbacteria bacterium RIFCSPHIGHO2_01_FULL_50_25 TaxID=1817722 RepID=A0A1F5EYE0_9BACT|nr:MAG: hypothetical protein A2703_00255 [Candidatus Collierbacteria bacterium RIFCSPHIGHO2_01_FULL_50_25]